MVSDRVIGALLCIGSVVFAVGYFLWLFFSPWSFWAVAIPVFIMVAGFLFVVAWIGWTMATTTPPKPESEEKTGS